MGGRVHCLGGGGRALLRLPTSITTLRRLRHSACCHNYASGCSPSSPTSTARPSTYCEATDVEDLILPLAHDHYDAREKREHEQNCSLLPGQRRGSGANVEGPGAMSESPSKRPFETLLTPRLRNAQTRKMRTVHVLVLLGNNSPIRSSHRPRRRNLPVSLPQCFRLQSRRPQHGGWPLSHWAVRFDGAESEPVLCCAVLCCAQCSSVCTASAAERAGGPTSHPRQRADFRG